MGVTTVGNPSRNKKMKEYYQNNKEKKKRLQKN